MKIRPATKDEDFLALSKLYQVGWQTAYKHLLPPRFLARIPADQWVPYLKPDVSRMFLLEIDGHVCGVATYGHGQERGWESFGELKSIYLKPALKRQGYGGQLLETTLQAMSTHYDNVYLWVIANNWPSRFFYEKHHFTLSPRTKQITIGGQAISEVAYTLNLKAKTTKAILT